MITGQLLAKDKDGTRVRPVVIPSFLLRVSLWTMGSLLNISNDECREDPIGARDPRRMRHFFGLHTAWLVAEPQKVLLALDAGGAHSNTNRSNIHNAVEGIMRLLQEMWYGTP